MVPAEGGQPRRLTSGKWRDYDPVWRPDGKQIAFESDRSGNADIWVMDLE
ncbi:MAG: TolB family protein [Armatimonadota bacterium]